MLYRIAEFGRVRAIRGYVEKLEQPLQLGLGLLQQKQCSQIEDLERLLILCLANEVEYVSEQRLKRVVQKVEMALLPMRVVVLEEIVDLLIVHENEQQVLVLR